MSKKQIIRDISTESFSLLYPFGKTPCFKTLSSEVCNDLSLDTILDNVAQSDAEKKMIKRMMTEIESDPDVIRYRSDIFEDILRYPGLREKIKEMLEQLEYLKTCDKAFKDKSVAPVWQLVNRLLELGAYIDCIIGIHQALSQCAIKSAGLQRLKAYVSSVYNDSGFDQLRTDINALLTETSRIKSITLGVNLDESLRPVSVGVMSINKEKFDHSTILDNFLGYLSIFTKTINGPFDGMTKLHSVSRTAGDDPMMKNLTRVVSDMLGSTVKQMKSKLSQYVNVNGYSLTKFIPEFTFYVRWAEFCTDIIKSGMPMAKAVILDRDEKRFKARGLYNLKLAIRRLSKKDTDIVTNDFEISREHGIYIMTGPNRGGKTTFTQAVGLIMLMAQQGLFVPASGLRISPCDNIFTHFPADENQTVDLGRLGEESKRISQIFRSATEDSLLLFNEPLATTSFTEGLYIAKDVVRALRFLGARTVFNTHMHELAMSLDEMNAIDGDMKVASLITGVHEGRRSYKVFIAPPEGISYARDIAEKYGVTLDQLKGSILTSVRVSA